MDIEKRNKIIAFVVIWVVLFVSTIFAIVWGKFAYGGQHYELKDELVADEFFSKWQSYIDETTALNEVVTPGSHDAGTLGMMPLAETQGHNIADQLRGGVRYFDIRVTTKGDDLVIFHDVVKGEKFSVVLEDIKAFIAANPSEFLILDFQHLGKKCHNEIIDMISETLDMNKAMKKTTCDSIESTTMKDVRDHGYNYAIIWPENSETTDKDYLYSRKACLKSPYVAKEHRAKNPDDLIDYFQTYYDDYNGVGFFVLQAQRTSPDIIFSRPADLELEFKDKINAYVAGLIGTNLDKTNIVMRDFIVSDMANVKTILKLNLTKGIVDDDKIAEYTLKLA